MLASTASIIESNEVNLNTHLEAHSQINSILSELGRLIKKYGFGKALIKIKSLNKENISSVEIELFEFIVNQTAQDFSIPTADLYTRKKSSTHARMSVFVLLSRYMNYTHEHIGSLFEKERNTISTNMKDFLEMERSKKKAAFKDFFEIFDALNKKVEEKIKKLK